jgi:hypothetical protein
MTIAPFACDAAGTLKARTVGMDRSLALRAERYTPGEPSNSLIADQPQLCVPLPQAIDHEQSLKTLVLQPQKIKALQR